MCFFCFFPKGETSEPKEKNEAYCFLHMGMTGRISNPKYVPKLESLSKTDKYPPPHTHLIFRVDNYEAAFSDPRKFGAIKYADTLAEFDELAPDGLNEEINPESLIGKKKGIKSILLDQKAAVSGIGNWVADEVLYQSKIHPDQSFLDTDEVKGLLSNLIRILRTAVHCLKSDEEFPEEWIFNFRWKKGQAKNETIKDFKGRPISFVTAGGRGSAIVKSIQKLSKRSKAKQGNFSEINEENATCNTIETRVMQKRSREAVPEPAATVLKKRSLSLRIKREI